ncbi:MAG: DUF502 domain-containing protein [Proteobacteria bacterium]|nr:DUF502 domain-containing protein [Pseudomonadota bacterium]
MKKYLITGLLIWIPIVITIWVLKFVVDTLDQTLRLLPEEFRTEAWLGIHIPGMGVIMTLVIVFLTGLFATNLIGARLVRLWHYMLHRIPVVSSVYSSVKQISDTIFSSNGQAFRKALLVQWPREGMWTIAFLTGLPGGDVVNHLKGEFVSLYVPTTPNPTGGYFVMVRRDQIIELDMSVDEALKYIVSMGVVAPGDSADGDGA